MASLRSAGFRTTPAPFQFRSNVSRQNHPLAKRDNVTFRDIRRRLLLLEKWLHGRPPGLPSVGSSSALTMPCYCRVRELRIPIWRAQLRLRRAMPDKTCQDSGSSQRAPAPPRPACAAINKRLHRPCTPPAQFTGANFPASPLFMPKHASCQWSLSGSTGTVGLETQWLVSRFTLPRNPTNTTVLQRSFWLLSANLRAHHSVTAKRLRRLWKALPGMPAHPP
ncbi:hypothetical protein B0J12DRAFT_114054 [Macrophomina phaseolina]|uniref:Uncharacterized protein n=1 Tax=Macrophomina phaseolina TaxID=35725 RepID=A0ABQ8G8T6_9PEZI|nr:hypothetical protein B0J12DRAFT_114054 [Macrophomina phaseolina]